MNNEDGNFTKKKSFKVALTSAIAVMTAAVVAFTTMAPTAVLATSDSATADSYQDQIGDASSTVSTKNAGRVWTDKTVLDQDRYLDGNQITLDKGENFNVVFSAMSSSERIKGKANAALDVVFILDVSGSMDESADRYVSRIKAAKESLQNASNTIIQNNPDNRIGIATFSDNSKVLLNLGNHSSRDIANALDGIQVEGGTNTQLGFAKGMDMLINEKNTSINVDGKQLQRIPIVVFLSDGASTYSSSDTSWWNPDQSIQGPGDTPEFGNGMKAMLTASYKKDRISEHYSTPAQPVEAKVYTIGFGVSKLNKYDGNEKALAQITLNPTKHWNDNNSKINNKIRAAWEKYNTGVSVEVTCRGTYSEARHYGNKKYIVKHPTTGLDVTDLKYDTKYFEPTDSQGLENAFKEIVNNITTSIPNYPTDLKGITDPTQSGYITFTDPIGQYMEVKKAKYIIFNGQKFNLGNPVDNGNTRSWTASGTVTNPVTNQPVSVEGIQVSVSPIDGLTKTNQVMTIQVPAALIPLRIYDIELDVNGNVSKNTPPKNVSPVRVVYSVGLIDGADDLTGVSDEYIQANSENGKVNFYSNLYLKGQDQGEAVTQFTPSEQNPNYYFQKDTVIYKDAAFKNPMKSNERFVQGRHYYLRTPYYNGNKVSYEEIERNADQMNEAVRTNRLTDVDGNMALKAGVPRIYHIDTDFKVEKEPNTTGTAPYRYVPKIDGISGNTINTLSFYHGNNGKLQVEAPKSLIVSKTVKPQEGFVAPDTVFRFEIDIPSKKNATEKAVFTTKAGEQEKEVVFNANGKTIVELKDGESIAIPHVPGKYTVKEVEPGNGYTVVEPANATGSVGVKEDVTVAFENGYAATPVEVDPTALGFPIHKTLINKNFEATDQFKFQIEGNGPMPEKTTAIVDGKDYVGKNSATTEFGKFTFTKPGTYTYTVSEVSGQNDDIPGINYDTAKYRFVFNIKDDQKGSLVLDSVKAEKQTSASIGWHELTKQDNIVFVNTFNAETANVALSGKKLMANAELLDFNRNFTFKITAKTKDAPMPQNTVADADRTTGTISFEQIQFETKHVGNTYEYAITEIQPTSNGEYDGTPFKGAVKDEQGNWTYKGITFDHSEKAVTIKVDKKSEGKKALIVTTVTGNNFEFSNTYNAEKEYAFKKVDGDEFGVKKMEGRTFKHGDEFIFDVTSPVDGPQLPKEVKIAPTEGNNSTIDFGTLKFTQDDDGKSYTYTFKERKGNLGGVTYDESVKTVTLTIKDNADGTLSITRTGDELVWTNKYEAKWTHFEGYNFTGSKELTGKDIEAGMFTFNIKPIDGAPTNGLVQTSVLRYDPIYIPNYIFDIFKDFKVTSADMQGDISKKFVYEISESIPEPKQKGMTYDENIYRVHITAIDDLNGTLNIDGRQTEIYRKNGESWVLLTDKNVLFKNAYHPIDDPVIPFEVDAKPMLSKKLTGPRKEPLKANEFKFSFELKSASVENGVVIKNQGPVGNKADGTVEFKDSLLTFKEPGTYVFTIKEASEPAVAGVQQKVSEMEITYIVTDEAGQLVAKPKFSGAVKDGVFVNEYTTEGRVASADLGIEKKIQGRDWISEDVFTFKLAPYGTSTQKAAADKIVTLENDSVEISNSTKAHKANFGDIVFTQPGNYEFRISEVPTGLQPGMKADTADRIVKVAVTDNGDGTMATAVTGLTAENRVFTNKYEPGEVVLPGEGNLSVFKVLEGRKWLDTDAFTFKLAPADKKTEEAMGSKVVLSNDPTATEITITMNSTNKSEHFADITFKDKGEYTFKITEEAPTAPNVTGSTEEILVHVHVELEKDGTLSAAVVNSTGPITVTNEYVPTPGKLDGATNLAVTKTITNREWLEGETFDFSIALTSGEEKNVVMPASKTITVNGTDQTNHFGDITFKDEGQYVFEITEKLPEGVIDRKDGLTYDKAVKKVVVDVKDNLDGTLSITKNAKLSSDLSFNNVYQPDPLIYDGKTNLQVKKVIENRDWQEGDEFTFKLKQDGRDQATVDAFNAGDFVLPQNATGITVKYNKDNKPEDYVVNFGDIIFKKAGTYKFLIKEEDGKIGGLTYDTTAREITVTVTDDHKGKLTATANGVTTITNKYHAEPVVVGKADLQVSKVLTGRDWKESDEFEFTLRLDKTYDPGSFKLSETTCKVTGKDLNKVASFGPITFYKPHDNYDFMIQETVPEGGIKDGVTFDQSQKRVSFKVYDDHHGKLHVEINPGKTDNLLFTNVYKPSDLVIIPTQDPKDDGMIGIKLNKILTGREWKEGDSFSFKLESLDGAPLTTKTECTITEPDQMFDFGILTITHEDMNGATFKQFRYKVTEIIPEDKIPGVTYETKPITFVVTASDNGKGFLIAGDGTPDSGLIRDVATGENYAEFTNNYTPEETKLDGATNLKVVKQFIGREEDKWLDTDAFTFKLSITDPETSQAQQNGDVILPSNADEIKIQSSDPVKEKAFGDIQFKKPGVYKFTVSETNQNIKGVTYAANQEITVNVEDNLNGKLVATVAKGTELKPFTNKYETGTVTLNGQEHLQVAKKIDGRQWIQEDVFTFNLEANDKDQATMDAIAAGNVVMPADEKLSVTINKDTLGQTSHFGDITFKDKGKYQFKVTEVLPEEGSKVKGLQYATEPQIITVDVVDNGDGTLTATTDKDVVTFTNTYTHDPANLTGVKVKKTISGRDQWIDIDYYEMKMTAGNEAAESVKLPGNVILGEPYARNPVEASFADMEFTEPGEYIFYVSEVIPETPVPGVSYDKIPHKVTVTVTDNNDGTMTAKADPGVVEIKNVYSPKETFLDGSINLNITKELYGRNWNAGDAFTFSLKAEDEDTKKAVENGDVILPHNANRLVIDKDDANNGSRSARSSNFGNIIFKKAGIYQFEVNEEKGNLPGVTYAERKGRYVIAVFDDQNTGKLVAVVHQKDAWEQDADIPQTVGDKLYLTFINTYHPENVVLPGLGNLNVEKMLQGREFKPGDKFEFEIEFAENYYGEAKLSEPTRIAIEVDANGEIIPALDENGQPVPHHFGDITFERASSYSFIISEIVPDEPIPGMTYAGPSKVDVTIVDDLKGKLQVESISKQTSKFVNIYKPENGVLDGATNLQVQKVFDGRKAWQDGDSFTFELAGKTENTKKAIKDGIVQLGNASVTIDKDTENATAAFGDITFKKPGSYVFEVSEIIPDGAPTYINYDKTKKSIFVEVVDNVDTGKLVATLSGTDAKSVFTNTYNPDPVKLDGKTNLTVTKDLQNREWIKGDTFLFSMAAEDDVTSTAIKEGKVIVPSNFDEISITDETEPKKQDNFGSITFKEAGTFKFRVSEVKGTIEGITYDEVGRIVTVVVSDNLQGKLSLDSVTVTADPAYDGTDKNNLVFTNTYNTTPATLKGSTDLVVAKAIKGRDFIEGDNFTFELTPVGQQEGVTLGNTTVSITNAEEAKGMAFGDIQFTETGTYEFNVHETSTTNGVTNAVDQKVVVKVTDNKRGKLEAKRIDLVTLRFVNKYVPEEAVLKGETDLLVKKSITGRDFIDGDNFTFKLTPDKDYENVTLGNTEVSIKNAKDAEGKAFGDIKFTKAGIYFFNIHETSTTNGVTNAADQKVIVEVTEDQKAGKLTATRIDDVTLEFVNKYTPKEAVLKGETDLLVKKSITGREFIDGDNFTFELTPVGEQEGVTLGKTKVSIKNAQDAKGMAFGDIKFTKKGTYEFNIHETSTTKGVTNAADQKVIVEVTEDQKAGKLVAKRNDNATLEFVNKYDPDDAVLKGETDLLVKKSITGRDFIEGDNFTFELTPVGEQEGVTLGNTTVSITNAKEASGTAFGDIQFAKAGTYEFNIHETSTTNGVTNAADQKVIVKVTEDQKAGKLTATRIDEVTLEFVNKYTPKETVLKGETDLLVKKSITGREFIDGDNFTFELTPVGEQEGVTLGKTKVSIKNAQDAKGMAFGDIKFTKKGTYEFNIHETSTTKGITNAADQKVIVEVTEDQKAGKLVAKRSDNATLEFVNTYESDSAVLDGKANLNVKKTIDGRSWKDGDKFTFVMEPDEDYGEKVVLNVKKLSVTISNEQEGKDGKAFGDITFKEAGTYNFTVKETGTGKDGMVYDSEVRHVVVTVTPDYEKGKLVATRSFAENSKDLTFVNTYKPGEVPVDPTKEPDPEKDKEHNNDPAYIGVRLEKVLNGREWLEGDSFTFEMKPVDGAPAPAKSTATVTGPKQKLDFGQITFTAEAMGGDKVKSFDYVVSEVIPSEEDKLPGVTYETREIGLTITVKDNDDGTLTAKVAETSEERGLTFVNTYKPGDVPVDPTVKPGEAGVGLPFEKVLTGRQWKDTDFFEFKLEALDENAPMPAEDKQVATVTEAKQEFDFGTITFTSDDMKEGYQVVEGTKAHIKEFHYQVTELPGTIPGITYDANRPIKFTITVTDKGNGKLEAAVAKTDISGNTQFTNTFDSKRDYEDPDGKSGLRIVKTLNGHDMADGQFKFDVKAQDKKSEDKLGSKKIEVATSGARAAGEPVNMIPFDMLQFDGNDIDESFTYVISEQQTGKKAGYTYDTDQMTVVITVKEQADGTLMPVTTVGETVYEGEIATVVFDNLFEATETLNKEGGVNIEATKVLTGRNMNAGEFQFEVVDKNENVVATGTNGAAADGEAANIQFTEMLYDMNKLTADAKAGLAEHVLGEATYTYQYKVNEVKPASETKVTAETLSMNIKVVVTVDEEGTLGLEVVYPEGKDQLQFVNTYAPAEAVVDINGQKKLTTPTGAQITLEDIANKFTFNITAQGATYNPVETVTPLTLDEPEIDSDNLEGEEPTENDDLVGNEVIDENLPAVVMVDEYGFLPVNTTATNDAAGNISFGKIRYDVSALDGVQPAEDGSRTITFNYRVDEVGQVPGITNDGPQFFSVQVTDDGQGTMTATLVNETSFVFENVYTLPETPSSLTNEVNGNVQVVKALTGRELKAEEFHFVMDEIEARTQGATGTNNADGVVTMTPITFKELGEYTYVVRELPNDQQVFNGVTYDEATYTVKATVTDNKDGTMKVVWTMVESDKEQITFTNTYEAKPTEYQFGAMKVLTGRELKAGEFKFVLKDSKGNVVDTTENQKDGTVQFRPVTFKQTGTYKYTIEEVKGNEKDIKYDDNKYTVMIEVKDDFAGHLSATRVENNETVVFVNKYEEPKKPVTPGGSDTGYATNMATWAGLMAISGAAVAGATYKKRKSKK